MLTIRRVFLVVLDSVGVGALPDAAQYGDEGSHTLGHVADAVGGLRLPNLELLGLGLVDPVQGVNPVAAPRAAWGRMQERSAGKDTTTGHWEMAGVVLKQPFPTYPHGFPREIVEAFECAIGRGVLGNFHASGTEIIQELGEEHLRTGKPIVYTSADSVFQVAAHEEVIPLAELYRICRLARESILIGKHAVGRVIARPFLGKPGGFYRTAGRHDYSLFPPEPTLLDRLQQNGLPVTTVGKVFDIFAGQGITKQVAATDNQAAMAALNQLAVEVERGFIFANLVDFDMLFGHRNDAAGYAQALEDFDTWLPQLLQLLSPRDVLIITADHGTDPGFPGTDHSREYVPLLVYGMPINPVALGTRTSFSDVAATIAEWFQVPGWTVGTSFAQQVGRKEQDR